ncbi:hypothetical protein M885DRAFT_248525 [Pelagophyceae sp. CCMP2097]|nr:hypothetical protein M885DRAFT_248525 [Pelagophyceae sp. CCMP2097]
MPFHIGGIGAGPTRGSRHRRVWRRRRGAPWPGAAAARAAGGDAQGDAKRHPRIHLSRRSAHRPCRLREPAPCGGEVVMHLHQVVFAVLGGKLNSFAPSNLAAPGAFARRSLSATKSYASGVERSLIAKLGGQFGCHSCGARRCAQFIADHQPPQKFAVQRDATWLRRTLGLTTKQRFFPHCTACSLKQSVAVRVSHSGAASEMVQGSLQFHFLRFRRYHLTGAALPSLAVWSGAFDPQPARRTPQRKTDRALSWLSAPAPPPDPPRAPAAPPEPPRPGRFV